MNIIIPSLASANQINLAKEIDSIPSAEFLHFDIEDGNFIPNITFGMKTAKAVSDYSDKPLDVHLLVMNPGDFIDNLLDLNVASISFQIEATQYPAIYLNKIRSAGKRAGLAFNFQTSILQAAPYFSFVDYVLIMMSEPDGDNQRYNPYLLNKIAEARRILPAGVGITVDGGISEDTLIDTVKAGADTIIMGRTVWKSNKPSEKINELLEMIN